MMTISLLRIHHWWSSSQHTWSRCAFNWQWTLHITTGSLLQWSFEVNKVMWISCRSRHEPNRSWPDPLDILCSYLPATTKQLHYRQVSAGQNVVFTISCNETFGCVSKSYADGIQPAVRRGDHGGVFIHRGGCAQILVAHNLCYSIHVPCTWTWSILWTMETAVELSTLTTPDQE